MRTAAAVFANEASDAAADACQEIAQARHDAATKESAVDAALKTSGADPGEPVVIPGLPLYGDPELEAHPATYGPGEVDGTYDAFQGQMSESEAVDWPSRFTDDELDVKPVCFAAGTPILLADGSSKPIEQIQPGDMVLAASDQNPEGPVEPKPVVEIYHNRPDGLMELTIGDAVIRPTLKHPFYVRGKGWTAATDLQIGDELRTPNGGWAQLHAKHQNGDIEPVFNFHVGEHRTYFVGDATNGTVLAHNQSGLDGQVMLDMDYIMKNYGACTRCHALQLLPGPGRAPLAWQYFERTYPSTPSQRALATIRALRGKYEAAAARVAPVLEPAHYTQVAKERAARGHSQ